MIIKTDKSVRGIKVIVFDLDNTLYWLGKFDRPNVDDNDPEYRKFVRGLKLSDKNKSILNKLRQDYQLVVINYDNSKWRFEMKRSNFHLDNYFEKVFRSDDNYSKIDILKEIIKEFNPKEILVIGDKKHHDIYAGNFLGCHTVQIMLGRHANKPATNELEEPDFQISDLSEIFDVLEKLNNRK